MSTTTVPVAPPVVVDVKTITDDLSAMDLTTKERGTVLLQQLSILTGSPCRILSPSEGKTQEDADTGAEKVVSTSTSTTSTTTNTTNAASTDNSTYYWKKGTGYGHDDQSSNSWDVDEYVSKKKEKKNAILTCVKSISAKLSSAMDKVESEKDEKKMVRRLSQSCLIPFLADHLANFSITEVLHQAELFTLVATLLKKMVNNKALSSLLSVEVLPGKDSRTLATISELVLPKFAVAAEKESKLAKLTYATDAPKDDVSTTVLSSLVEALKLVIAAIAPDAATVEENRAKMAADSLVVKDDRVDVTCREGSTEDAPTSTEGMTTTTNDEEESKTTKVCDEKEYVEKMAPLRFGEVDDFTHHKFLESEGTVTFTRPYVRRLATEFSDLAHSLPIHPESSVFLRVHEEKMCAVQFLITAPMDTPYGGGCFLFDVYMPSNYPSGPPKANLQTTGGKTVRFNPNLYNDGYVCLSLLGTWEGDASESWNAAHSTLLQLAVSMQSLIFVPEPYFNEPGYESSIGTDNGKAQSDSYNKNIEAQTIRWAMVDMLKNPPKGFEEVIKTHFSLRKDAILANIEKWEKLPGRALEELKGQLVEEFKKLES